MIFYGQQEWVRDTLGLGAGVSGAIYPYKYRFMPIQRRNFAMISGFNRFLAQVQVELESRLTGRRGSAAGCALVLGRTISYIPILVDVRRTSQ